MEDEQDVINWSPEKVAGWLIDRGFSKYTGVFKEHKIDGKALLLIDETDLKSPPISIKVLGDIKHLGLEIKQLKAESYQTLLDYGYDPHTLIQCSKGIPHSVVHTIPYNNRLDDHMLTYRFHNDAALEHEHIHPQSSRSSDDGRASTLRPEIWKAVIACGYCFVVTWITAFVMVIVHDRVPDMKKYPPLPDIFLDNVPHIPWAFHMCEWTGSLLGLIWLCLLIFHKHRFILLRRFFALSGTVFLLRCITMLITSLSVPGTHLDCNPRPGTSGEGLSDLFSKMKAAYTIWKGGGMSIQGVRTCGDYMFSGHTVALTMLNFFITEYSPRDIYILHTFTWLLNMFGIFFILSGHEHYSIDVFIAFYITSRLFLYYHTLANNQSLMQRDTGRTRIWFPLFSFFESDVDGIVPNEFDTPMELAQNLYNLLVLLIKQLIYVYHSNLTKPRPVHRSPSINNAKKHKKK